MSVERDLFVTSEVVIWSFQEDAQTVFVVTQLCDEYGNPKTASEAKSVKTQDGVYYKHDDWKTGATIESAIAEYCGDDENCKARITSQMRSLQ